MPALPKSLQRQFLVVFGVLLALAGGLVGIAIWELDHAHRRMQDLTAQQLKTLRATTKLASLTEAVSTGTANLLLANDANALIGYSEGLQRAMADIENLQPELLQDVTSEVILDLLQRSQAYRAAVNAVLQLRQEGFRDEQELRERLAATVSARSSLSQADLLRIATTSDPKVLEAIQKEHQGLTAEDGALLATRLRQLNRLETLRKYSGELQDLGAEMTVLAQSSAAAAARDYDDSISAHLATSRANAWKLAVLLAFSLIAGFLLIRHLVQRQILQRIDVVSSWLRGKVPATQEPSIPVRGRDEIADMARAVEAFMEDRRRLVDAKRAMEVAREEAERANQMKSTFLANISHEIRTPMNAILGYAQILARDVSFSREQLERIATINRAGEHLLALINDILEMSKIEAGRVVRNDSAFDLHSVLQDLLAIYSGRAQAKGITLVLEKSASLPQHVHCDEGKLRQTLVNLLGNAVKFTEEGGVRLIAGASETGPGSFILSFTVADTGPGLSAEAVTQLFRPFVQSIEGAKMGGTGLGLAISRQYARLLGGDVTVESTPGHGANFTFTAVATEARATDVTREVESPPVRRLREGKTARILVVDDDETNRKLLQDILEPIGFEIKTATNGAEAVEVFSAWKPAAIMMDICMPIMNGIEATRRIRATGQSVLIIGLSASAFEEEKAEVLASGADLFVRKPFKVNELLGDLGRHLNLQYEYGELGETAVEHADFSRIPDSLRAEFSRACDRADYEHLLKLCDTLEATEGPEIANAVRARVITFNYESLARLMSEQVRR